MDSLRSKMATNNLDISRCTDRVRQLIVAAKKIADDRNRDAAAIDVLEALSDSDSTVAHAVLERLGVQLATLPTVRCLSSGAFASIDTLLQQSIESAKPFGHNYVGTEHLLLGMIQTDGEASMFLRSNGVTFDSLTQAIRDLFTPPRRGGTKTPE